MSRALATLAAAGARVLPAPALRWLGRRQFAGPLNRRLVTAAAQPLRHTDVTIRHGAGAGLRFNAGGANAGYALGTTEPLIQEVVTSLLRPGSVFYDIGANVGFFSVIAARLVGDTGKVVSFEPLPENVRALEHNVALNGFDNVVVRACAVSSASGRGTLRAATEQTMARLESAGIRPDAADALEVELVTLDGEVAAGLPAPDVVKMDVEGAEPAVLDGMSSLLRDVRPILLIELHGANREVAERLRAAGYELETIDADEPLEDAPWWVHVLATPATNGDSS